MSIIEELKKEISGENNASQIASYEQMLANDIERSIENSSFFSLPIKSIASIISKIELNHQKDPITFIKTLITQTIAAYPDENETILLLPVLKTNELDLSLESCVEILSLFRQCNICFQLHRNFLAYNFNVDVDVGIIREQKEKEIIQLKQELEEKQHIFTTVKTN